MNAVTKIAAQDAPPDEGGMMVTSEQLARFFPGLPAARARRELRMLLADLRDRELVNGPTTKPENVRLATQQDEDALWEFANIAYRDNGYMFAPINPDKVMTAIRVATRLQGGLCAIIDSPDGDGAIAASMICVPDQWWWSEQFHLRDLWTYVRPEFRKSRMADDVTAFMKWAADQWSAKNDYTVYLVTGVMSVRRPRDKVRFFRKNYNEVGGVFIYPAPPGMQPG